jgi:hypothetical protein
LLDLLEPPVEIGDDRGLKGDPATSRVLSPATQGEFSMRPLVSVFVLVLALSANAAEQRTTLDQAAEDYVHLALEIGAHEKDFVDAYFGPPEWRVEAEAHPRNISELKAEADRIQSTLSATDMSAQEPMEHRRNAWLMANVASARSRLDINRRRTLSLPRRSYTPVRARARVASSRKLRSGAGAC